MATPALDITGANFDFGVRVNLAEAQAVADLTAAYAAAWERLHASYKPLADRVLAARAAGKEPRVGDLHRMERFTSLMAEAEASYKSLAAQGGAIANSTIRAAMDMGIEDYRQQVANLQRAGAILPGGADWDVSLSRDAVLAGLGYSSEKSPLNDLFRRLAAGNVTNTRRALVSGIVSGKGTDMIARDLRRELGVGLWRSQLIARTEAHRVYREVGRLNAERNPDAFDGWIWRAACDARTCAICWSKHGTKHGPKEVMVTHPGCRCACVPMPRSFADIVGEPIPDAMAGYRKTGEELFAKLPPERQRAVLGPGRFNVYRQGFANLGNMVEAGPKSRWGRTPRLIPLRLLPKRPVFVPQPLAPGESAPRNLGAAAMPGMPQQGVYPPWVNNAAKRRRYDRYVFQNPFALDVPRAMVREGMVPGTHPRQAPARAAARAAAVNPPIIMAGRPAQAVGNIWHPVVPPGARPMNAAETARFIARGLTKAPLEWDAARQRWAAPSSRIPTPRAPVAPRPAVLPPPVVPRPAAAQPQPVAFPAQPAQRVPHPTKMGVQVPLPAVAVGARPMNAGEIARQAQRKKYWQDDLVWKPAANRVAGQGHWGRARGAPVTQATSHGGKPGRAPAFLPHGPGHGVAPVAAPAAGARLGGKPPPAGLNDAQKRRWQRWRAENPNEPAWREPGRMWLKGGRSSTIGPPRPGRSGAPMVVRRQAARTPVFPRGKAPTGAHELGGQGRQARVRGRAAPGALAAAQAMRVAQAGAPSVPAGARAMNADEAMRNRRRVVAGMPPLIFKPGAGGGHWGAVVARTSHGGRQTANPRLGHGPGHGVAPRAPSVLAPLPVPAHVPNPLTVAQQRVDDQSWTGTVKSMTPRTPTNPRASAQRSEGTHTRGLEGIDGEILLFRMQTWPVVRTKRGPGVTSSRAGFEAWLADPLTGEEIHVYIKPTYGQSPGIRSAYMLGKDETEREYAGYRLNELLGRPLDHQVTIIRNFGPYVNPDSGKVVGHSIVNLWTDPAPGYGTVHRPHTAFRDFPAAERSAAAMYDALVFNTDRHSGNYYEMEDPQGTPHIIAIDPSLAFPHFRNGQGTGHGSTDWTSRSQPLTPELLERLAGILIDEVSIRAEFEPMLGRNVVDGLFKRARWMYQHGRTLSTLDLDQQVWWNS